MKFKLEDLEVNSFTNVLSNDAQAKVKAGYLSTEYTGVGSMCNATSDTKNAASKEVTCPNTMQSTNTACKKEDNPYS